MSDTYDFRVTLGGTTRRFTVPRSPAVSWEQLKDLISTRFNLSHEDSEQLVVRFRDERTTITVSSAAEEHYLEGHLEYWADEGRGFANFDAEVVKRTSEQDNTTKTTTTTATGTSTSTVDVLIGRDPLYTLRTLSSSSLSSLSLSSFAGSSRLALSSAGIAPVAREDKAWLVLPGSEREGGGGKVLMRSEEDWDRVGKRAVREVYERGVREGRWTAARFSFEPLPSTSSPAGAQSTPAATSPASGAAPPTAASANPTSPIPSPFEAPHPFFSYPPPPFPPYTHPSYSPFSYPSLYHQPSPPSGPPKFPPVFPPPFEPGPVRPPYPLKPPHRARTVEAYRAEMHGRLPQPVEEAGEGGEGTTRPSELDGPPVDWERLKASGRWKPVEWPAPSAARDGSAEDGEAKNNSPPLCKDRYDQPALSAQHRPLSPPTLLDEDDLERDFLRADLERDFLRADLERKRAHIREKLEVMKKNAEEREEKEKQAEKEKGRTKAAYGRRRSWGSLDEDEEGEGKEGFMGEQINSKPQVLGQRTTDRFDGRSGNVPAVEASPAAAATYESTVRGESTTTSEARLRTQLTLPHLLPNLATGVVAAPRPSSSSSAKLESVAASVPFERAPKPSTSELEVEDKLSPSPSDAENAFESVDAASGSTLSWDDCGSVGEVCDGEGMSGEEEKAVDDPNQEEMPELVPVYSLIGNSVAASAGSTSSPPRSLPEPFAAAPATGSTMTMADCQKFKIKVRRPLVKELKFNSSLNPRTSPADDDDHDMPPLTPLPPLKRGGNGFEAIYIDSSKSLEDADMPALVEIDPTPSGSGPTETSEYVQELPELEVVGETKAGEIVDGMEKKREEVKPSPVDGKEEDDGPPPLTLATSPAPLPSPVYSRKLPFIRVDAFDTSADVAPTIPPWKPEVTASNVIVCDPRWRAKLRASKAGEERTAVVNSPPPLAPARSASTASPPAASAPSAASAPASTPPVDAIDLSCSSDGDETHSDDSVYPPRPRPWMEVFLEHDDGDDYEE
ncbi:hypothetical protein JCM8097_007739 [Rhodosporidiobolus ruineniae]